MQDKTLKCDLYQYLLDGKYGDGDFPGISNAILAIVEDMVEFGQTPLKYHFMTMLLTEVASIEPNIIELIRQGSSNCLVCNSLMHKIDSGHNRPL